jgi:hypothetical protein
MTRRLLVLIALLPSCVTIETRTYSPGVEMEKTPEGGACYRQCLAIASSGGIYCAATLASEPEPGLLVVTKVASGRFADEYGCAGMFTDCLLSCPGAKLTPEGPRWIVGRETISKINGEAVDEKPRKKKAKPQPDAVPADAFTTDPAAEGAPINF